MHGFHEAYGARKHEASRTFDTPASLLSRHLALRCITLHKKAINQMK
jgi:hypothetical protein